MSSREDLERVVLLRSLLEDECSGRGGKARATGNAKLDSRSDSGEAKWV